MAAEKLMQNIYTFANILSQAHSEMVSQWDDTSLQNAFNWADYCQQVYQQIHDKPYRETIEQHLSLMTLHLHPPSCIQLTVQDLAKSRLLMNRALLQNSCLPEKHIKTILSQQDLTGKEYENITQSITFVEMGNKILRSLPVKNCGWLQLHAEASALMESLLNLLSNSPKKERFETYLMNLLDRGTKKNFNADLILTMLTIPVSDVIDRDEDIRVVHNIIIKWISRRLKIVITKGNQQILQNTCQMHSDFMILYTDFVMTWADSMQASYDVPESSQLYSWRDENDTFPIGSAFESLCSHIQNIMTANIQSKHLIYEKLNQLRGKSYFNIYKDILKKIKG